MKEANSKGSNLQIKKRAENEQVVHCDGVFEYIGAIPSTDFLKGTDIIGSHGFIETNERMSTKIPGIFGAGDCISKHLRQVVTATSDGAIAAQEASSFIKALRRQENVLQEV